MKITTTIIKRFVFTFVLVLFALSYINYSFWLMGSTLFEFNQVLGLSMLLILPFLPMIIDPDEVF